MENKRNRNRFYSYLLLASLFSLLLIAGCGGGEVTDNGNNTGGNTGGGIYSIQVTWDQPTTYSDDAPLNTSDIASYRIYYGTASGNYSNVVNTTDPAVTTWDITNLAAGTYYITVTVVLNDGRESGYSNEISRSI